MHAAPRACALAAERRRVPFAVRVLRTLLVWQVLAYKYIIHECTFLGPPSPEADAHAGQRGHTHYAQLHRFICAAPDTIWLLVHWSIRYTREDVEAFFRDEYGGVPRNVVLWL